MLITSLLYLTTDRSWQVQLVRGEQEPRKPLWQTDCCSDPFYQLSLLVTKSLVSVITNALIISNCPMLKGENHFCLPQPTVKLCVDANFVSWSLYLSTSLELTSAEEFLKLIQQSDCVWVQPDINWTPDLFIGRKNGNCKKNIGLLSWYRTKYFISDVS